tara:strand:- start:8661 stop:9026 length:366 start_codon:yes stop_codon:yes gene_type:complete
VKGACTSGFEKISQLLHGISIISAHLVARIWGRLNIGVKNMQLSKLFFVASMLVIGSTGVHAQEGRGQGGGDRRPPPEAFEACEDKSEGDSVTIETRRGDTLSATCEMMNDSLVAVPEDAK